MLSPLTKRQKEILDFIKNSISLNGYAPSLQEIKDQFRLKAISTVHEHLENLKNKGYIKKEMNQSRGIQLARPDQKPNQSKIRIKGVAEKGEYCEGEIEKKALVIDNYFLKDTTEHFGLIVKDTALKSLGYNKGDVLVLAYLPKTIASLDIIIEKSTKKIKPFRDGDTPLARVVSCIHVY